jgi:hypothetical protein
LLTEQYFKKHTTKQVRRGHSKQQSITNNSDKGKREFEGEINEYRAVINYDRQWSQHWGGGAFRGRKASRQ